MSAEKAPIPTLAPAVAEGHQAAAYPQAPSYPGRSTKAEIILPKWIYIKDREGRYLVERSGPVYATLTFRSGDPTLDNAFQTTRTSANWYTLHARSGTPLMRYYHNPGWYSSDQPSAPSYNVISASGNKVYLKDDYANSRFFSNELMPSGAPLCHDYINETSQLEIIQAAIKNEIIDIVYDINGATVREVSPIVALSTSVRNDSDGDVNQTLTYT